MKALNTPFEMLTSDASKPVTVSSNVTVIGMAVEFVGDDDVWVFVNEMLVIDLGGIHGATEQYVDLNRLGLEDGETYTLDFFFAERHRTQSNFRFQTNLLLEVAREPNGDVFD